MAKLTKAQCNTLLILGGRGNSSGVRQRNWRSLCDKLTAMGLARYKGPGPHEYEITDLGRAQLSENSNAR